MPLDSTAGCAPATHNNIDHGRWYLIQHVETSTRVLLRVQRQFVMGQYPMGEIRITGITYLPEWAGDPVASPILRGLPTSKIEAAINRRQFAVTGTTWFQEGKLTLPSGRTLRSSEVIQPLGDPKRTPDFYELVALQHTRLTDDGDPNPTATMARVSNVPLSTAQGWVARARRKVLTGRGGCRTGRQGRPRPQEGAYFVETSNFYVIGSPAPAGRCCSHPVDAGERDTLAP